MTDDIDFEMDVEMTVGEGHLTVTFDVETGYDDARILKILNTLFTRQTLELLDSLATNGPVQ